VKRDDDFFPESFIHQTTKRKIFFFFSKEHKKLQPIKFLLFPAGGTRDRTKEKKETLH
jgi:hypothetical protein